MYQKKAAFPKNFLKPQGKINMMPNADDNPVIKMKAPRYKIRRAEEVQEEHK